jgi:pyruvate/2-oxoglutarate dehydrogenase complex dihydrolipoamide dehydrogenase (E3) component
MKSYNVDLCVIGAGSAGLSVAAGAVQLGLSVVLFEAGEMGGDCLNYGCVPSKALIAAGARAQAMRAADRFGIAPTEPQVDWPKVQAHVRHVIAAIEPNDSQERFEKLGVTVIRERARFADPRTVVSDSVQVRAKRIVIATGSRAVIPGIPGLDLVGVLTNETIFSVETLPSHLAIIGAGPIGLELGQAFRRLGAQVTLIEAATVLARADRDAAAVLLAHLNADGVSIMENASVIEAARTSAGVTLKVRDQSQAQRDIAASHVLVAAGRAPVLDGLNLEAANVTYNKQGVVTSPTLRSISNSRVWALGDAAGRGLFTHLAGWHASVWVRNVLFKARTETDSAAIPAVIYTDPELAQVGLTEADARDQHGDQIKTASWGFDDNDRAHAQHETEGFCKLIIGKSGKLLGATIVGAESGELLGPITLALSSKLGVRALTGPVLSYPTRSEIWKRAAGAYFTPTLFSPGTRALVNILKRIP